MDLSIHRYIRYRFPGSQQPFSLLHVSVSPLVAPHGDSVSPPSAWPWPLTAGRRQACRSRTVDNCPRSSAGESCSLAHSIWIHILPSGRPAPGDQRKERCKLDESQDLTHTHTHTPNVRYNSKCLLIIFLPFKNIAQYTSSIERKTVSSKTL